MNGDGLLDLVVANDGAQSLGLFERRCGQFLRRRLKRLRFSTQDGCPLLRRP